MTPLRDIDGLDVEYVDELLADFRAHHGQVRVVYPAQPADLGRFRVAGARGRHAERAAAVLEQIRAVTAHRRNGYDEFGLIAHTPSGRVAAAMLAIGNIRQGGVHRVVNLASTLQLRGAGTVLMAALASLAARTQSGVAASSEFEAIGFYEAIGMWGDDEGPHDDALEDRLLDMSWTEQQVQAVARLALQRGLAPAPPSSITRRERSLGLAG
jgi:hypothetical protein